MRCLNRQLNPLIATATLALSVLEPVAAAEPTLQISSAGTRPANVARNVFAAPKP